MTALPEDNPIADMLNQLNKSASEVNPKEVKQKERIHFRIPGMPEFKSK